MLQRPERAVLSHHKVQDSRTASSHQTGRRPRVSPASLRSAAPAADSLYRAINREVGGEWGSRPLYRMLGYFSIIGLLRVHVLLGDYTLALKMMDDIELNKKAWFTRVNAAHVTVYYCASSFSTSVTRSVQRELSFGDSQTSGLAT